VTLGAALASKGWLDAAAYINDSGIDVEGLRGSGFDVKHTICHGCAASCGLTALVKTDEPVGEEPNFILMGNQDAGHPQPGICGRGASSLSTWNSPMRLKKPMKLVGERGSGEFEEISWEQALSEIAAKLKDIIETDGPEAIVASRHKFKAEAGWLTMPLGTPNLIGQASTCNTAGVVARKWMMGRPYRHHATVDPDYDNARFVLLPGRQLVAPVGVQRRVAKAKANGCRFAFLNPSHPTSAYGDNEWIPCKPGTDAAFMLGVSRILVDENLYDEEFVRRYTNLPFMIRPNGKPLTAADLAEDGNAEEFKVFDGDALVGHDKVEGMPVLAHEQTVTLADGSEETVRSAWMLFKEHLADYTPSRVTQITGVPASTVDRIARTLARETGVVEDTWYNTRNGNDTDAVMAILTVNGLLGNFNKPGGLCKRPGTGLPGGLSQSADTVSTILGNELKIKKPGKSIDKQIYPETNGSFEGVVKSVLGEEDAPYKVKAVWMVDGCPMQRDNNTRRIEQMLKGLELFVITDVVYHEACDYADYVLPADMFVERDNLSKVSWTHRPTVHFAEPVSEPPPGSEPRHLEWFALELVNRIYPERAKALGYRDEFFDPKKFREGFQLPIQRARIEALAKKWGRTADDVEAELKEKGFINFDEIVYDKVPYEKPFSTASGKLEIYSFVPVMKGYRNTGLPSYFDPPAFTMPSTSREFIMVSGKSSPVSSGVASLSYPAVHLGDNRVWIHPADAERLDLADNDRVEIEGIDTGWKAETAIHVTNRIVEGSLFCVSYIGGNRQKKLKQTEGFEKLSEGINIQWFTTAALDPVTGSNSNNASVRITRKVS
jgi:anaerobic selenocysteine-containing dehydrogenase